MPCPTGFNEDWLSTCSGKKQLVFVSFRTFTDLKKQAWRTHYTDWNPFQMLCTNRCRCLSPPIQCILEKIIINKNKNKKMNSTFRGFGYHLENWSTHLSLTINSWNRLQWRHWMREAMQSCAREVTTCSSNAKNIYEWRIIEVYESCKHSHNHDCSQNVPLKIGENVPCGKGAKDLPHPCLRSFASSEKATVPSAAIPQ